MGSPSAGAIDRFGEVEVEEPRAAAGEVVVRVIAAALNPADLKVHRGEFAGRVLHARTRPLISGYDLSGVVESCGEGVSDLSAGDEVFGFLAYSSKTRHGSFGERVAIARSAVARKPASISHELAAAAATSGLSALQAMRDQGGLRAGGRALVIGAAGGVGSVAVGVAKALGAHVTAVCSTPGVELVRGLGADEVIDRRVTDPRSLTGPFDVIFDAAAAYSYSKLRHQLAPGGAFVCTLPSAAFVGGKLQAVFSSKRCRMLFVQPKTADLEQLAEWLAGGMSVPIDSRFHVRELAKAFERFERGDLRGRIAVDVASGW
jgi:NADPH:quinone reductase-like Zn-dependent oxidoreductase